MIRIRCMTAPQVGDSYRLLDGVLMTDMRGFPITASADQDDELQAISTIARVARVGAYWSHQPTGTSGHYVELTTE